MASHVLLFFEERLLYVSINGMNDTEVQRDTPTLMQLVRRLDNWYVLQITIPNVHVLDWFLEFIQGFLRAGFNP